MFSTGREIQDSGRNSLIIDVLFAFVCLSGSGMMGKSHCVQTDRYSKFEEKGNLHLTNQFRNNIGTCEHLTGCQIVR